MWGPEGQNHRPSAGPSSPNSALLGRSRTHVKTLHLGPHGPLWMSTDPPTILRKPKELSLPSLGQNRPILYPYRYSGSLDYEQIWWGFLEKMPPSSGGQLQLELVQGRPPLLPRGQAPGHPRPSSFLRRPPRLSGHWAPVEVRRPSASFLCPDLHPPGPSSSSTPWPLPTLSLS